MRLLRKASKILYSMAYSKNEFTNEPKHILQHKALLARRIIRLITGQNMETGEIIRQQFSRIDSRNSQISNLSHISDVDSASIIGQHMIDQTLRESILDQISSYQLSQEENPFIKESVEIAKNQLRNVFSSGVYVPQYLCSQSRFQEDLQQLPQLIDKNQHIEDSRLRFSQNQNILECNKKLAFCPTYVITRQIFKKIVIEKKYCLMVGVSGVGKTYSFILYKILSEMIFQYLHFMRHEYINQQISQLFKTKVYQIPPKVAFWCIDENQSNTNKLKKILLVNCIKQGKQYQQCLYLKHFLNNHFMIFIIKDSELNYLCLLINQILQQIFKEGQIVKRKKLINKDLKQTSKVTVNSPIIYY